MRPASVHRPVPCSTLQHAYAETACPKCLAAALPSQAQRSLLTTPDTHRPAQAALLGRRGGVPAARCGRV